ncbi:MAG: hypothetical protein IJ547_06665 [Clostridia bacterium]|nr:hypothetical protein [Clostridia bacterium]MBQ8470252.1 hypothetical protein [Clostridia bacterium]
MKQTKLLSLLVALMMLFGSMVGTAALAATTAPADNAVVAEQASEADTAGTNKVFGQQVKKLLIFGAIVGILAVGYGLTTMRYNQEKMDDMTQESRKMIEKIKQKEEQNRN